MVSSSSLLKLKDLIMHNSLKLAPPKPMALFGSDYLWGPRHHLPEYSMSVYDKDSEDNIGHIWSINPFDYVKDRSKYNDCLEKVFAYKYRNLNAVIDNDLLSKYGFDYHVVILDATDDFVQNYFLQINDHFIQDPRYQVQSLYQEHAFSLSNKELCSEFLKYPTSCLLFYNDDYSYFCALPCVIYATDTFDKISVSIDQIRHILEPLPLHKDDDDRYLLHAYYAREIREINVISYINMDCSRTTLEKILQTRNIEKLTTSVPAKYIQRVNIEYFNFCSEYMSKHLRVFVTKNGQIHFYLDKSSPSWDNFFKQNEFCSILLKYTKENKVPLLWSDKTLSCEKFVEKIINSMNLSVNDISTNEEDISDLINSTDKLVQPILPNKGLNGIFSDLGYNDTHKFYVTKNRLFTAFGTNKLEDVEIGAFEYE